MVMGNNSTNINKTMESLNGDGQQFSIVLLILVELLPITV
jgi:hypothetical protein